MLTSNSFAQNTSLLFGNHGAGIFLEDSSSLIAVDLSFSESDLYFNNANINLSGAYYNLSTIDINSSSANISLLKPKEFGKSLVVMVNNSSVNLINSTIFFVSAVTMIQSTGLLKEVIFGDASELLLDALSPMIKKCVFSQGSGISNENNSSGTIDSSYFISNSDGIQNMNLSPTISNTLIEGSRKTYNGGGINNYISSPYIVN